MKCVVKKGKSITELNDADRRAMRTALAVCGFVGRNTEVEDVKAWAADAAVNLEMLLAHFADEPAVVAPKDKEAAA